MPDTTLSQKSPNSPQMWRREILGYHVWDGWNVLEILRTGR